MEVESFAAPALPSEEVEGMSRQEPSLGPSSKAFAAKTETLLSPSGKFLLNFSRPAAALDLLLQLTPRLFPKQVLQDLYL